jgi:hypothetical protein
MADPAPRLASSTSSPRTICFKHLKSTEKSETMS